MTATGFTYPFTNLAPNQSQNIIVTMLVPTIPIVSLGDLVTSSVSITGVNNDIYPESNSDELSQTIVGSYDPNDITESHGPRIVHSSFSADDYLIYTIQFENTGTANAVNVRIEDVLDDQLAESTLQMVAASHPYVLDRTDNNLIWRFNAIELPPSVAGNNDGKGFVTFRIKPEPGYAIGDNIPNTASIFFDFNPPIVTNTFGTEFVAMLQVSQIEENAFVVYPNPVESVLYIRSAGAITIDFVSICDISGKTVIFEQPVAAEAAINISSLSAGVYFAKIESAGTTETVKILKR
jgi:hypothetical protein